jgi:hypothetical protein
LFCVGKEALAKKYFEKKLLKTGYLQGCQMAHFQTKNPNLGKF